MQQMYGLRIRSKCFRDSSATLFTPERCVNIHSNHPDLHGPFSSVHSHAHVLSGTCHWHFIFMPLLSKFSHKVPTALPCCFSCLGVLTHARVPSAASPEGGVDLMSPATSTAPRCFSGALSSALLTGKTSEPGKSCSTRDLFIPSENALCRSLQKQLVLGPAHFCPTSSPPQQVTAAEPQAAYLALPSQ